MVILPGYAILVLIVPALYFKVNTRKERRLGSIVLLACRINVSVCRFQLRMVVQCNRYGFIK